MHAGQVCAAPSVVAPLDILLPIHFTPESLASRVGFIHLRVHKPLCHKSVSRASVRSEGSVVLVADMEVFNSGCWDQSDFQ